MRRVALVALVAVVVLVAVAGSVVGLRVIGNNRPKDLRWAALGDSYSSGLGEMTLPVGCARDVDASYVGRAANLLRRKNYRITLRFAPCADATLDSIFSAQDGRAPAQIENVDPSMQVVTLTLGGNDLGFGDIVSTACLMKHFASQLSSALGATGSFARECAIDADHPGNTGGEAAGWTGIEDKYVNVLSGLLAKISPTGQVFVLTYPLLFADPASWSGSSCFGFTVDNARALNLGAIRMGDAIDRAVQRANAATTRVRLVDWREQTSETAPWAPHGLCGTQTPWVHGIRTLEPGGLTVSPANSFHPTAAGYAAAAELLAKSIASSVK